MNCPYPDCSANQAEEAEDTLIPLWDEVVLCRVCGRIGLRCPDAHCKVVNRPFTRFCVLCGQSQWDMDGQLDAGQLWQRAAEFDRSWRFIESTPPVMRTVHTLSRRIFRPGVERPTWIIGDGVIFLHQGGRGVAAVHAFGDLANRSEAMAIEESELFHPPGEWRLHVSEKLINFQRPYPPLLSKNRMHLVYSTPYGVATMSPGLLEGWCTEKGKHSPRTVLDLGQQDPATGRLSWLAAQPVLLDRTTSGRCDCWLGLLLATATVRNSSVLNLTYAWHVVNASQLAEPLRGVPEDAVPLSMTGDHFQIEFLGSIGLLFATNRGLWLWPVPRTDDPKPWDPQSLIQVWSQPGATGHERVEIVLDQQIRERNYLSWRSLVVLGGDEVHQRGSLRIWLRIRGQDERESLQRLDLYWNDGRFGAPNTAMFPDERRVIPVGSGIDRGGEAAYFFAGDAGQLRFAPFSEQTLRNQHEAFANPMSSLQSVQVLDPLVILVRDARIGSAHELAEFSPDASTEFAVQLRTLTQLNNFGPEIGPIILVNDPLFWLSSLFCLEVVDKSNEFVIRRYDLPVVDSQGRQPTVPVVQTNSTVTADGGYSL